MESRRQSGLDELKSSCNRYYDFENHIMQILCKSKSSSKRVINLYNYSLRRTFIMAKNSKIKQLTQEPMESEDINSAVDLKSVLKEMIKNGVEALLEGELDNALGYPKHDRKTEKANYRNGKTSKSVKTDLGCMDVEIPRDRNSEFEPELVPKNSSTLSSIEDKVISMYAKDMSTRDISEHIEDLYNIPLSAQSISRLTDKVLPVVQDWQNRPLDAKYHFIYY